MTKQKVELELFPVATEVFFIANNDIQMGCIDSITSNWHNQPFFSAGYIEYRVRWYDKDDGDAMKGTFHESKLFETKELLISSL